MKRESRENLFDFMRLFAALTVVVVHSVTHYDVDFFGYDGTGFFSFRDGVAMFFIMSGFLVYKSCYNAIINEKPLSQYFKNRYLRVAPALYVYIIITATSFFLLGVLSLRDVSLDFLMWILSAILLIPVYYPDTLAHFGVGVTNGSLWTIPVEVSFYILLPIIVYLKIKLGSKKMLLTIFFTSILGSTLYIYYFTMYFPNEPIIVKLINVTFLPHLIYFSVGILFTFIWRRLHHSWYAAIGSLLLYFTIVNLSVTSIYTRALFIIPAKALFLAYFIFWFAYYGPKFLYHFTKRIGDISYGVYVWHMVIINYFIYFGVNNYFGSNILVIVTILLSITFGLLSWYLVERKFLKYKPYVSSIDVNEQANSIA